MSNDKKFIETNETISKTTSFASIHHLLIKSPGQSTSDYVKRL